MSQIIVPSRKLWTPPQKQRGYVVLDAYRGGGGGGGSDPYWSYVVSLLNFPGADGSTAIIDETGMVWSVQGNAQIDTSLGYNACQFDGSGDWLGSGSTAAANPTGVPYCIEAIIIPNPSGRTQVIANSRDGYGNGAWFFCVGFSNKLVILSWDNSGSYNEIVCGTVLSAGTQYHVAAVKVGTTWTVYLDGISDGSGSLPDSFSNHGIRIGFHNSANHHDFHGHMRAVRITKGVARYTSSFTPPTAPFPNS